MKLINPHYVPAETPQEADVNSYQAQVETWLSNNTDKQSVSFAQIRAFFSKTEQQWPDGVIHSRLTAWGYEVTAE